MGVRGPAPKSAELRIAEGERAHRPLPASGAHRLAGMPERPRGMTAGARRIWDEYAEQLGPLGVLRPVDGFALRRLCEDVAMLQELQSGARKYARQLAKEARAAKRELRAGAMIELAMSQEGRRLASIINVLAARIKRDEMQFGLTPVASQRLENIVVIPPAASPQPGGGPSAPTPVELALCG